MRWRQSIPARCWFLAAIPPSAQLNQNRGKGHRLYGQVVSWTQARLWFLIPIRTSPRVPGKPLASRQGEIR
jgi:hypothetical protein